MQQQKTQNEVNEIILEDRNKDIKQIGEDMVFLNEVQQELNKMVQKQGDNLDVAEEHMEFSRELNQRSVNELIEIEKFQETSRTRKMWLGIAVVGAFMMTTGSWIYSSLNAKKKE